VVLIAYGVLVAAVVVAHLLWPTSSVVVAVLGAVSAGAILFGVHRHRPGRPGACLPSR
jgi:hypothetical protein